MKPSPFVIRITRLIVILLMAAGVRQTAAQPVVSFTQPTNGQQIVTFAGLTGTAVTSTGTIQVVTFSIYNLSTGEWWDGTNFQGVRVPLPGSLAGTNWTPASGLALPNPAVASPTSLTPPLPTPKPTPPRRISRFRRTRSRQSFGSRQ